MNLHAQYFIHFEHVDLFASKNIPQPSVAHDLTFVGGVLEFIAFDIFPQEFHDLGSGKL
jgi:hypothetical protein